MIGEWLMVGVDDCLNFPVMYFSFNTDNTITPKEDPDGMVTDADFVTGSNYNFGNGELTSLTLELTDHWLVAANCFFSVDFSASDFEWVEILGSAHYQFVGSLQGNITDVTAGCDGPSSCDGGIYIRYVP